MQCLKCGREVLADQVFCKECLAGMESAPVKPGTPVTIPTRTAAVKKPPVQKQAKPEEIIQKLQRRVRRMAIWIGVLSLLLALSGGFMAWHFVWEERQPTIGQNYSTSTTSPEARGGR